MTDSTARSAPCGSGTPSSRLRAETAPAEPLPLFHDWFVAAAEAGQVEPHTMSLATVDEDGRPDVRTVMLHGADAGGWHFASHATSAKGRQLAARPEAALGFDWPVQGRQVRVRGRVTTSPRDEAYADLHARTTGALASALVGRQSEVLDDLDTLARVSRAAWERAEAEPGRTPRAGRCTSWNRPRSSSSRATSAAATCGSATAGTRRRAAGRGSCSGRDRGPGRTMRGGGGRTMGTYMDVHRNMVGITADELREAHAADLAIEKDEGVHFEKAWADPDSGTVYCLSTAPRPTRCSAFTPVRATPPTRSTK